MWGLRFLLNKLQENLLRGNGPSNTHTHLQDVSMSLGLEHQHWLIWTESDSRRPSFADHESIRHLIGKQVLLSMSSELVVDVYLSSIVG